MKRWLLLIITLLLCLPTLAEELPETEGTLIEGFCDEETCALLVDQPDGVRVFIGGVWEDDEWTLTVSAPLPPKTEMYTEDDDYYGLVTLGFYHPVRGETPWVEVGVSWMEDRWQVTDVMVNRGDMVSFEENCITSYIYDDYYGMFTLPLHVEAVDWLALPLSFEEAMALMDTSGFEEENADWGRIEDAEEWAPDPDTLAFCEAHLPGYTLFDGRVFEDGAVLLADDAQGLRYFFGCVRDGEEWVITRSTSLPEGASCETFHIGPDWLRIWLPLPRERQNVRMGETDMRCTVWLSGSRWEVGVINGIGPGGVMSFWPHAIHDDAGETYYGDYDLPLDVTEVDWSALPASWTEAIALLDHAGWAQVQRGGAAWYTEASTDGELLGTFTAGAPLRLLAQAGDWVQVSPIGSEMTGWIPMSDLLCGSDMIGWNEEYGYWHNRLHVPETGLYEGDTPLHPVAHEEADVQTISLWEAEAVDLLGLCSDGCCAHVYIPWADRSGYLPFYHLHPEAQIDVLAFRRLPEYSIYTGFINEDFFAYTMIDPQHPVAEGGQTYLFCGVKSKVGWWIDTLSAPLPAGVWPTFRSFDKGTGAFSMCLQTEALEDLSFTLTPARDGSWLFTGMTGTSRDTRPDSYTIQDGALHDAQDSRRAEAIYLERDLAAVDWLALPRSFDEAMALALPIPAGYTAMEGWQGTDTAMYLLKRPDGATVFAGLEKTAEGWRLTESSPLPPGECMLDTYHVDDGCITIYLPNEGSAAVALQEDGRWLLTWANDTSVSDHGLYFGVLGMYYADVNIERDITRLDWTALPLDYEDWLPWADSSRWAVVGTEAAPLYAENGSILAHYHPAAPVRLLEERGDQYRVAVNGSAVTGWMNKVDLLAGDRQLTEEEGDLALAEGYPETLWPRGECTGLLDSPEGKLLETSCYTFDWLGTWDGGWLHVRDSYTGTEGFVRAEEVMNYEEWLDKCLSVSGYPTE